MIRPTLPPLLVPLLLAGCAPTYECGDTQCGEDQYCTMECVPPGRTIIFGCEDLPSDCNDCDCLAETMRPFCRMVDGHPRVGVGGACPRSAN